MLRIGLLTVEDESGEEIHRALRAELAAWLFVRKGIVRLEEPSEGQSGCVTNLADFRTALDAMALRNDLVFCTVDLKIPDVPGGEPHFANGLNLVREIITRDLRQVRCCVLTGMAGNELRSLIESEESLPEVLFDFKGDSALGYRNVVNYIKAQALPLLDSLHFTSGDGSQGAASRTVLLEELTGRLREVYLSRAAYYADAATWHVPSLVIGAPGSGRRSLVEFVAFLAEAKLHTIDLAAGSLRENRRNFEAIDRALSRVRSGEDGPRELYYLANVDRYDPGVMAEDDDNCLWPLGCLLEALAERGKASAEGAAPCSVGVAFSVSGESRLKMTSRDSRSFLRELESAIVSMTGMSFEHLALDENGWPTDHPRIVSLPSLKRSGRKHLSGVVDAHLERCRLKLADGSPDSERPLVLDDDVRDFLVDKIDWSRSRNLSGLVAAIDGAVERFRASRAQHQQEITRSHLDEALRAQLGNIVLSADDVRHEFPRADGSPESVIERADFHVDEGELLVILGPSGCGKSTVLRMLAGLLQPTSGRFLYRGKPIAGPSEKIGFIFQNYSLFPWLTVQANVEYGPRTLGRKVRDYAEDVRRLLAVARLEEHSSKYPHQLSGGMQQRLAIVRALAARPDVLLMDEPFGALDVQTRWEMQNFLIHRIRTVRDPETREVVRRNTIVFVTHDIEEAVYVGDRIYVATPRPLRLADDEGIAVPFSAASRTDRLRSDPVFTALVNRVRERFLARTMSKTRQFDGDENQDDARQSSRRNETRRKNS